MSLRTLRTPMELKREQQIAASTGLHPDKSNKKKAKMNFRSIIYGVVIMIFLLIAIIFFLSLLIYLFIPGLIEKIKEAIDMVVILIIISILFVLIIFILELIAWLLETDRKGGIQKSDKSRCRMHPGGLKNPYYPKGETVKIKTIKTLPREITMKKKQKRGGILNKIKNLLTLSGSKKQDWKQLKKTKKSYDLKSGELVVYAPGRIHGYALEQIDEKDRSIINKLKESTSSLLGKKERKTLNIPKVEKPHAEETKETKVDGTDGESKVGGTRESKAAEHGESKIKGGEKTNTSTVENKELKVGEYEESKASEPKEPKVRKEGNLQLTQSTKAVEPKEPKSEHEKLTVLENKKNQQPLLNCKDKKKGSITYKLKEPASELISNEKAGDMTKESEKQVISKHENQIIKNLEKPIIKESEKSKLNSVKKSNVKKSKMKVISTIYGILSTIMLALVIVFLLSLSIYFFSPDIFEMIDETIGLCYALIIALIFGILVVLILREVVYLLEINKPGEDESASEEEPDAAPEETEKFSLSKPGKTQEPAVEEEEVEKPAVTQPEEKREEEKKWEEKGDAWEDREEEKREGIITKLKNRLRFFGKPRDFRVTRGNIASDSEAYIFYRTLCTIKNSFSALFSKAEPDTSPVQEAEEFSLSKPGETKEHEIKEKVSLNPEEPAAVPLEKEEEKREGIITKLKKSLFSKAEPDTSPVQEDEEFSLSKPGETKEHEIKEKVSLKPEELAAVPLEKEEEKREGIITKLKNRLRFFGKPRDIFYRTSCTIKNSFSALFSKAEPDATPVKEDEEFSLSKPGETKEHEIKEKVSLKPEEPAAVPLEKEEEKREGIITKLKNSLFSKAEPDATPVKEDEEFSLSKPGETKEKDEIPKQKTDKILAEEYKGSYSPEREKTYSITLDEKPDDSTELLSKEALKNLKSFWYTASLVLWVIMTAVFISQKFKDIQDIFLAIVILFTVIPIVITTLVKFIREYAPAYTQQQEEEEPGAILPEYKEYEESIFNSIKQILNTSFQMLLIIFLLILLVQQFYPALIEEYINTNQFLIIILILGVFTILTKKEDDERYIESEEFDEEPTITYYLFVIFMGILGAFLIWYKLKTMNIGYVTYLISGLGGILIIFLSTSIWDEEARKGVKPGEARMPGELEEVKEQVNERKGVQEREQEIKPSISKKTNISKRILNKLTIPILNEIAKSTDVELKPGMKKWSIVNALYKSDKLTPGIILDILKKQKETTRINEVQKELMNINKG